MEWKDWKVFAALLLIPIVGVQTIWLYNDIVRSHKPSVDKKNIVALQLYTNFIVVLVLISLYLLYSMYTCYTHPNDEKLIRTYRPIAKKVKDMTKQEKIYRKTRQDAKFRNKFFLCGHRNIKLLLFASALLSAILHPYAKKSGTISWFILLLIVSMPLMVLIAGVALFAVWLLISTPSRGMFLMYA